MIWLCSDWHFNHNREFIWKARGFESVAQMNEAIVERHNALVDVEDDVYVLGDLCLGPDAEANQALIERMNGRLHIIRGNHDTDYRIAMYLSCKNVVECNEDLWGKMIKYYKMHLFLSHFPTITGNLEKETLEQCTCNIFGHTHQNTQHYFDLPYTFHCGMDSHNCQPTSIDEAIAAMKACETQCRKEL